ncbi:Uncharacterized protein HZ326_26844 [Fusarium oxysporum f. sp. albedinis]|nr:L-arabinose-responsive transcription regulator ARA1 [Fusarium oxysporum f. sp. albedinis]KAJ0130051.1 Uncharacterized protein HZ326_26844 [Fusarium oxysporum f. sp. albedinis]
MLFNGIGSTSHVLPRGRGNARPCWECASINAAWIKLNEYYTLLGRSPLFAASVVLNPDLSLRWLETNWASLKQLQWLGDAKDGIKAYFERWYEKRR